MTALDDLSLLRTFVRVAECSSISEAARTLGTPQPTVSRHLKTLEVRANTVLARRDTHSLRLTEAGIRLLEDAREILDLADAVQERLAANQGDLRGHLRLFSTIDLGQFILSKIATEFRSRHPEITMELSYTNQPLKMIEGGYDAGVLVGRVTDESVVARPAGEVLRYLVASPEIAEALGPFHTPEDVRKADWVGLNGPQFGDIDRIQLRSSEGREASVEVAPKMTLEGATGLREALRSNGGVGLLGEWLVREDLASGTLVRLLPDWVAPGLPIVVIFPSSRNLSARVRAFGEFATERISRELQNE